MNFRKFIVVLFITIFLAFPQIAWAAGDIVRTGDIVIAADERVMGDVVCLRGNVDVHGEVYGDVVALTGHVTVHSGGVVHGDVVTLLGAADLHSEGRISGDQVSLGGIRQVIPTPSLGRRLSANWGLTIFNIVIRFGMAVLIAALFPAALSRVSGKIERETGRAAGIGALTWLAALPLTLVIALTIIGIPLSLLLLLGLWAAYYLGFAAISLLAGSRILPKSPAGSFAPVATGAVILSLLIAFPFIGWLIRIAVGLMGVGAVVLTRFGSRETI